MKINVFEGTRRIVKLVTVLSVVGFLGFAFFGSEPYITATYIISSPVGAPIRSETDYCAYDNANKRVDVKTNKGTEVHVTLCFLKKMDTKLAIGQEIADRGLQDKLPPDKRADFDDLVRRGVFLLPENKAGQSQQDSDKPIPPGRGHFVPDTPSDVKDDVKDGVHLHVIETFVLPQTDWAFFDDQWWQELREHIQESVLWLVGGLAFLWMFTWATGWIIRGFLGIPMGHDRKLDTDSGH